MEFLNDLAFELDPGKIFSQMGERQVKKHNEMIEGLLKEARENISPGAVYMNVPVEQVSKEEVVIDGKKFASKVLSVNLQDTKQVFPYIITAGSDFEDLLADRENFLQKYFLDLIGNIAVSEIQGSLFSHLEEKYELESLAHMNPGSLEDWPLEEQKPLFGLFGEEEVKDKLGVILSPHLLMRPRKSLSGLAFFSLDDYCNCQLCQRKNCPGRQAPYDSELSREYGN